jgi:AraC-like DNA-binding protein
MDVGQVILIIVSGLGVFHGLFVAVVLWNIKGGLSTSNRLLSMLMLVLSLRIAKSVMLTFLPDLETLYVYLGLSLLTLIGPLFLLYSKSIISRSNSIRTIDLLHLLPGFLFIMMAIPLKIFGFNRMPDIGVGILLLLFYGHLLAYLLIAKFKFINPAKTDSLLSPQGSKWLDIVFYSMVCLWIVYVLNVFEDGIPYIVGPILYSAVVYTATYLAISGRYLQAINTVKYQTTNFTDDEVDHLFQSVENMMHKDLLYLNQEVTLSTLASQLNTSVQKLSFVINSRSGVNFNEYINRLRIKTAMEMLQNPDLKNLTIAAIGFDAGFNSLSSFNISFKKFTGKTPSAYRKTGR